MTVDTGGPVRGFLGRWLMRVQAVQGTLQLVGISVTAGSTMTTALVQIGYAWVAPYVLAVSPFLGLAYAWIYVEGGILNRKNREASDRGNNYATPRDKIDDTLIGTAVFAAVHGRQPDKDELDTIEDSVTMKWNDFRNGVDLDE